MDQTFTTTSELPPLQKHALYLAGMAQIDSHHWQNAVESFQTLQNIYPDNAEVKAVLKEVQMRATMAQVQPRHKSKAARRRTVRWFGAGLVTVIIIAIGAYGTYVAWIKPVILYEFQVRQVTRLRNEADAAMMAGDYARARQTLAQLQTILPEDPETLESLGRAEQAEKLAGLYGEAQALIAAGNWDQALEALTNLQSLDTQYRDLPQLLQIVKESQALDRQFQAAEAAFERGEWADAISQYEALQRADLTFKFDEIQARLFESQLLYGRAVLETAGTETELVTEALSHYAEALKLRPIDAEALNERRLAETYLAALNSEDQDETIKQLQKIYSEQPDYAGQASAQLLYTGLMARAESSLAAGNKEAAITDYQQAAQLLVEDPAEAQQKLAELISK
ncbi:MAG: tetratricopeptide repeat protein [Chloroflexota bacterium]